MPLLAPEQATITFAGDVQSTAGVTPKTFAAAPIGTAAADRYVAVVVAYSSGAVTITSVTVGGQATTEKVTNQNPNSSARWAVYLTDAPVAAGTTADVVVTLSGNAQNMGIATYALTGLQSTTATDSQTTDTDGATMNLAISGGGVAIGGAVNDNGTDRTFTTSGLTEDVDKAIETGTVTYTAGSGASEIAQTLAVVVDCSATDASKFAAGCVSFR